MREEGERLAEGVAAAAREKSEVDAEERRVAAWHFQPVEYRERLGMGSGDIPSGWPRGLGPDSPTASLYDPPVIAEEPEEREAANPWVQGNPMKT